MESGTIIAFISLFVSFSSWIEKDPDVRIKKAYLALAFAITSLFI